MSPIDTEIIDFLRAEAGHVSAPGDFARAAMARDRRNRTRRTAALVAAAAVALAVPSWLTWSQKERAVPPATNVSDLPTSTKPTYKTSRPAVVVAHATFGPATASPDVSYSENGVAHYGPRSLPAVTGRITSFAPLDTGGDVVSFVDGASDRLLVRDASGRTLATLPGDSWVSTNHDGTLLAWSAPPKPGATGSIHVMDSHGRQVADLQLAGVVRTIAGDVVYVQIEDANPARFVGWNARTGQTRSYDGFVRDVDEASGLALVSPGDATNPYNICTSLVDLRPTAPTTRWTSCEDFSPGAFSPSGRYILGTYRNLQVGVARVTDGHVVLEVAQESGASWGSAMNSEETAVTFSATDGPFKRNALVRCTLDGQCQVVGEPHDMGGATDDSGIAWRVTDR